MFPFAFRKSNQQGFTLMEIVVATAVFTTVVAGVLALFVVVMRINKQVQSVRQASQGMRNFTEILVREIRNGRISYTTIDDPNCNPDNYQQSVNQALGIITYTGDEVCLYLDGSTLKYYKNGITETINPNNFTINSDTFRFFVRPGVNPNTNVGIQPMVTILAEFVVNKGSDSEVKIPYQTTISSDVYDSALIPSKR